MEKHMPSIMVNIRASRRHQPVPIPGSKQRLARTRIRPGHRGCRGVADIIAIGRVAVCREEEIPGSLAVQEGRRFDDTVVGGAFVVEDGGGGAEEGDAVVAQVLDAERGGRHWGRVSVCEAEESSL
jgi:hypothetical protein